MDAALWDLTSTEAEEVGPRLPGRGGSLWDSGTKARELEAGLPGVAVIKPGPCSSPEGTTLLPPDAAGPLGRGGAAPGDPDACTSLPLSPGSRPRRSLRAKHAPPAPTAARFPLADRPAGAPAPPPHWLWPPRSPSRPSLARQPSLTSRGLRRRRPPAQPSSPSRQRRRRGVRRRMVRALQAAPRRLRRRASAERAAAGRRPPHRACGRPAR